MQALGIAMFMAALGGTPGAMAGSRSGDVRGIGGEVLAKILRRFKAEKQAHGAMRIVDMTDLCRTFPLAGKTAGEANAILKAAGQKFDLVPNRGPGAGPDELAGGLVLENDGFAYSAVFNIRLHATKGKGGIIDAVVDCNVVTRSL
jgi:hypothetical protein